MRMAFPATAEVCNLSTRTECRISSAVLPVNAIACSMLTNSTSAPQLSHQVRVSDPHWRMIQTRSRSMVIRIVLLPVMVTAQILLLSLHKRSFFRSGAVIKCVQRGVRFGAMSDNFAVADAESLAKILKKL